MSTIHPSSHPLIPAYSRLVFRIFADMQRVERRAFAQVVGDDPQVQAEGYRAVMADAADEHRVGARRLRLQQVLVVRRIVDQDDTGIIDS